MSRIGKSPIPIPEKVEVGINKSQVEVKGPKGSLALDIPELITLKQESDTILVERSNDEKQSRALHGLVRSLVNNMVVGVTEGFKKELEIHGVGYRAEAKGDNKLVLQLGFSHPVEVNALEGVTFEVPEPTRIIISGIDKQAVGQSAAQIRALKKPEPYKGKGIRYTGEHILRKSAK